MRGTTSPAGLGGTILICAIALRVSTADIAADPQLKPDPGQQITCGNQPCDAVARGFRAFHDRTLVGMGGNGRSCADCHMPSTAFSFHLQASRLVFKSCRSGSRRIRPPTIRSSGPSTRTTSA